MLRGSVVGLLVTAGLSIGVVAAPRLLRDAAAGEEKVADSLLKSGRQALSKGDHAGAIAFFKKALEENPDLIEACWWRASAQEKAGDKPAALASYREFVALFEARSKAGGTTSKEEQRLKGLADRSIDTLAAGEKEFRKMEDAYIASLLAFAKDHFVRDPGVSLLAVEAVLAVRPDHEEALKLRDKLGGAGPGGGFAAVGPFKDVKTWRDLIADRTFQGDNVTFSGTNMLVDAKGGSAMTPAGFVDTGKSFAFEIEFRITSTYDARWVTGLGFAFKDSNFFSVVVLPGRIALARHRSSGGSEDLAEAVVAAVDPGSWHRLGLVVKGPAVEAWFDGNKMVSWTEPSNAEFVGEPAIVQERCRTEARLFRVGKVE